MGNLVIKVFLGMLGKLITQNFFSRMIVIGLHSLSQSSVNTVDDKMVDSLAKALDVKDYK